MVFDIRPRRGRSIRGWTYRRFVGLRPPRLRLLRLAPLGTALRRRALHRVKQRKNYVGSGNEKVTSGWATKDLHRVELRKTCVGLTTNVPDGDTSQ